MGSWGVESSLEGTSIIGATGVEEYYRTGMEGAVYIASGCVTGLAPFQEVTAPI